MSILLKKAPEVLKGRPHGTPVDWWSLGILIFEMLTGIVGGLDFFQLNFQPPFFSSNHSEMYKKILSGAIPFTQDMSDELRLLLSGVFICICSPFDHKLAFTKRTRQATKRTISTSATMVPWARLG